MTGQENRGVQAIDGNERATTRMWLRCIGAAWLLAAVVGCAPFQPGLPSGPVVATESAGPGGAIAGVARAQIGVPYRYGGVEPRGGFDCSGLVAYAHAAAGIVVPRTAGQQYAAAVRVDEADLRPGDLVFFRTARSTREVSHVGVYTGERRFVHAPQTGRDVTETSLDDPYYRQVFAGAGRFYDAGDGSGPRLRSSP